MSPQSNRKTALSLEVEILNSVQVSETKYPLQTVFCCRRDSENTLRDFWPFADRRVLIFIFNFSPGQHNNITISSALISKMPRARKQKQQDIDLEDVDDNEPPSIEPYTVLGLEKTATADEIKSAYRKAALKHHPGMHLMKILKSGSYYFCNTCSSIM